MAHPKTYRRSFADNKQVHGANMEPIWDRQDLGGPHVGPMSLAIWVELRCVLQWSGNLQVNLLIFFIQIINIFTVHFRFNLFQDLELTPFIPHRFQTKDFCGVYQYFHYITVLFQAHWIVIVS